MCGGPAGGARPPHRARAGSAGGSGWLGMREHGLVRTTVLIIIFNSPLCRWLFLLFTSDFGFLFISFNQAIFCCRPAPTRLDMVSFVDRLIV